MLHADCSFEQIVSTLAGLGWSREPDRTVTPSFLPGEPELATFRRGTVRLVYTFNPAVSLRVLAGDGPAAAEHLAAVAAQLPVLGIDELRPMLHSGETARLLLGLLAAGEMAAVTLMDDVAQLRHHPDDLVSRAAAQVHTRLAAQVVQLGVDQLVREKARHPDRSVLFPRLGHVQVRRQVLRWLGHDSKRSNPTIDAVLRIALDDLDWEVRLTAVLGAARLGARSLGRAVRQVKLPKTSREGLDATDRRILVAARDAALMLLSGEPVPPDPPSPPAGNDQLWAHMLRCVAGVPVQTHDRVSLLLHALGTPLDDEPPAPRVLPASIRPVDDHYELGTTGLTLVWVPPLPHWLGDAWDRPAPLRPIARVTPAAGFWITQRPLTHEMLAQLAPPQDGAPAETWGAYAVLTQTEAQRVCAQLSAASGCEVTIPNADEWEMAARGPDGRRYPWGSGLEAGGLAIPSPWGCLDNVGTVSQWATHTHQPDRSCLRGGPGMLRCAEWAVATHATHAALRPVLRGIR